MVKKKKVLFHSDFALSKTGFGRNAKALLSYLYKTDKYEIVSLCGGITKNHPELERTPWKSYGSAGATNDSSPPEKQRLDSYGAFEIDRVVNLEKPDIYIGVQDFWGVDYTISKPWFDKINSVIWTTLDSLPLLSNAVAEAPKIKNFWVWSNFAEKEMHRLGHNHVKTIHGAIEISDFKPLSPEEKASIRKKNKIDSDNFIIGFVFRNQLRKSVPNLLQGFKIFKDANPQSKPKLLLHTGWHEGWNINKLCKENGVDTKDILTTYVCKSCRGYEIRNFSKTSSDCELCKTANSSITTGTSTGVSEKQLNEIYNMMDVYCHPFTSGGQEIPIQEAKLAGLITLVTNYSCGEEMCEPEAASIALDWNEYREFGTEFIKASTCPKSIAKNLKLVLDMPENQKVKMGRIARKWVIDNFSTESVGTKIEKFLDSCSFSNYEPSKISYPEKNPYVNIPYIEDPKIWIKSLYALILLHDVKNDDDEGLVHWLKKIEEGTPRQSIESYFRDVALKDNEKNKSFRIEELFSGSAPEDRIFVSINSSLENIFLSTKIIAAIKEKYPNKKIFVSSNENCQPVFSGNTMIESAIIQTKEFEDPDFLNKNFYQSYCLDNFSIKNYHSILVK